MKTLIVRSAYFSLGVSATVTAIATEWEWLKNPSGIFHDETGTHWQLVFDTAVSWFVPTLIYTFLVFAAAAIGLRLIRNKIRQLRSQDAVQRKIHHHGNHHE